MRNWSSSVDPKVLGERIRLARERLRYSQGDLANLVSRDQRAISEYENGKRKLASTDLPLFARVLEVPITYFFEGESDTEDLEAELLNEFRRLPSRTARHTAVSIMRALSDLVN